MPSDGQGECWDYPDIRSAKRKAKELRMGSLIVRNFNQADRHGRPVHGGNRHFVGFGMALCSKDPISSWTTNG
jgi:hypothetical protein